MTDLSADVLRAAELFDLAYRDTTVRSLGGPLEGEVRVGAAGVWRTCDGLEVFRCGDHPALQASVVASVDGRIGSSWSGEFTALFDSVELFIANAVAWERVRTWRCVAAGDVPVDVAHDLLDDMVVDAAAYGGDLPEQARSRTCSQPPTSAAPGVPTLLLRPGRPGRHRRGARPRPRHPARPGVLLQRHQPLHPRQRTVGRSLPDGVREHGPVQLALVPGVHDAPGGLCLALGADTRCMPAPEMERFVHDLERRVVDEAAL